MSDERADLIMNMLRAIRAEQAAPREKLDEIIVRLGRLEREVAGLHGDYAGLSVRLIISTAASDESSSVSNSSTCPCPAERDRS